MMDLEEKLQDCSIKTSALKGATFAPVLVTFLLQKTINIDQAQIDPAVQPLRVTKHTDGRTLIFRT